MAGDVVERRTRDDRDVRLGLRMLAERQRGVQARVPPIAERHGEDLTDLRDDGGVRAPLGLSHEQDAVEQLQTLTHEHPEIDEPLVLHPPPASGCRFPLESRRHDATLPGVRRHRQRPPLSRSSSYGAEVAMLVIRPTAGSATRGP